jgi:hypothetical protein
MVATGKIAKLVMYHIAFIEDYRDDPDYQMVLEHEFSCVVYSALAKGVMRNDFMRCLDAAANHAYAEQRVSINQLKYHGIR